MVCIAPGGGAAVHAYIPFAFQFHMVQLELIRTVRACIFFSSFNSIMVQLEHYLLQEQHCDALVSIP